MTASGSDAPPAAGVARPRAPRPSRTGLRDPRSIRRHILLLAAVTSGLAAVVLVLLVQLLLAGVATSAADRMLHDEAEELTGAIDSSTTGSVLRVPETVLNPGVVVYDARGRSITGQPPPALADIYPQVAADAPVARTIDDGYRVRAVRFTTSSGARGVAVVATRMDPYEQTERYALLITTGAGLVLIASSVAVAAWVSRRVLRPVAEMARTAEEWSERDLSRRFALGPPSNELTRLAETLDGLLDKVADAIRAEQRLTAELAHELRTPLAAIQGNAELLELRDGLSSDAREDLAEILGACRRMTDTITALLELARSASTRRADRCRVSELVGELRAHAAAAPSEATSGELQVVGGPWSEETDVEVAAPLNLAVRAVMPVINNAVRIGSKVRLVVEPTDTLVRLHVDDDGPGVDPALTDRLFEPGARAHGSGAGLGLALSRRVARSLDGEVGLGRVDEPPFRTRFTVELPRSQRKTNRR